MRATITEIVQYTAIGFMIYETIKLFFMRGIWENTKIVWAFAQKQKISNGNERVFLRKKNPVLQMMGGIYLLFLLLLFFTQWWWTALLMIIVGSITVGALKPSMIRGASLDWNIALVFIIDFILSIGILNIINPILFTLIQR